MARMRLVNERTQAEQEVSRWSTTRSGECVSHA